MKLNKILLFINLFFLQSYLLRFQIGSYSTNLQEVLIGANILTFLHLIINENMRRSRVASLRASKMSEHATKSRSASPQAKTLSFLQTVKNLRKHWIILSLILFTGISVVLVPIENNVDFFRHLKFLFFAAVLCFIFMETFKTSAEKKFAIKIAGYGALVFGIFSVIYNLAGHNVAPDNRLTGPLDAAVYLAYYLTPFFIFFIIETIENTARTQSERAASEARGSATAERRELIKVSTKYNLLSALILGMLILLTQSMGAIGGSLIIIMLYFFKNSEAKILKNRTTKISLASIFLIVIAAIFYVKIIPTIETKYSSLDERGEIWQTSKKLLEEPKNVLLGVGFGQFQQKYFDNVEKAIGRKPLDFYVLQPHNIFLLFILNFGIPGLAFILFCIYQNIKNIIIQKKDFLLTANFILLYFFLHGLIDTPFFKNDMLFLFILFLELCLLKPADQTHQN